MIGFIGAGNMGAALIGGNIKRGVAPANIFAVETSEEKRKEIEQKFGIRAYASLADAPETDVLVLAVKPQVMKDVVDQIKPHLKTQLIVSIAAGILCETLSGWLKSDTPVVRAMPNTPALIGAGITGLYTPDALTDIQCEQVDSLFNAVGKTVWLDDENLINSVTAVSGSGPAYFFYLMEAMQTQAIQLGLTEEQAAALIQQTALGAASLAMSSNTPFATLRQQVTSKGGTTAAALTVFDSDNVNKAIADGVKAAYERSVEMSKAL